MKRISLSVAFGIAVVLSAPGQVQFSGLDLNASSELLFTATTDVPEYGSYRTLFLADIPENTRSQLTIFPERIQVLGESGRIQIQNRFGLFRSGAPPLREGATGPDSTAVDPTAAAEPAARSTAGFEPVSAFPAFVNGNGISTGKVLGIGSSPDGRFLSYMVPVSPGYGELRIYDTRRDVEKTVSSRVELVIDDAPVKWSGDSQFLVYSRGNELYYFSVRQYLDDRILSERLRRIGRGEISSVVWNEENTLYYVSGSLVYRILGVEFFTRSLYQDLLKIGSIVGKLPYMFDPSFDRFWISPDGDKILLTKDGRNVNVLFLEADDYISTGETLSLPFLHLPRNTRVRTVLWSEEDVVTLLTASIRLGEASSNLYRLYLNDPQRRSRFEVTDQEGILGIELSPDGERILIWDAAGAEIRNYSSWASERRLDHAGALHARWDGNNMVVIAGERMIERVEMRSSTERPVRQVIALSQADRYGFNRDTGEVEVAVGDLNLRLSAGGWVVVPALQIRESRVASEDYRVYLENLARGSYRNMVMVRNVDTYGTETLFARPEARFEPFPEQDQPVDLTNFTHGSRIRRREVALVFNAIDSVAGLTEILNTLAEYDFRGTFFINGDFIERHPGAVREIASSGHEVGNLFYTYFDFSSGRFQITPDFIRQGLARNEDLFFEATGRELSLLWHAPYYFVSPPIISASRQLNYAYIGRDVDSMDWVALRDHSGISRLYKPTARIIEDVMEAKKPGSIIAMTVGRPGDDRPDGGREDYLFHRLDVLLNGLIERGYSVVPVSTLMDNAR